MIEQPDREKPRDEWSDPRTTPAANGLREERTVETTTTQKHTALSRTESRRRMIKAKRVGWEGTVGDYCTEAGLTEQSHGSMVRNYLKALCESGEAANLTPKKQKHIHYKILRRKRAAPQTKIETAVHPAALASLPEPPSQERMVALIAGVFYTQRVLALGVATVCDAISNALDVSANVWRGKGWQTVFNFAVMILEERRVAQSTRTVISVTPAFFADVDPYFTNGENWSERYAHEVCTWRSRRRTWERELKRRGGPTLLDQAGGGS